MRLVRKTPASWTQTLPVARGAHLIHPVFTSKVIRFPRWHSDKKHGEESVDNVVGGGCTVQRIFFFCWLKKRSSNFSRPPRNTWPPGRKGGNLKPVSWNHRIKTNLVQLRQYGGWWGPFPYLSDMYHIPFRNIGVGGGVRWFSGLELIPIWCCR